MAPRSKIPVTDDLCVRREAISALFDPPLAKSTFFNWVNRGVIVKARGVQGYYLLNATRVRLGMPSVNIKLARIQLSIDRCSQHSASSQGTS